jgi:prepilin-type N-terminal cleavage/methylation domain-containing protein
MMTMTTTTDLVAALRSRPAPELADREATPVRSLRAAMDHLHDVVLGSAVPHGTPGARPVATDRQGGFTLVELLIAVVVVALCASMGALYTGRASQEIDQSRDVAFGRERAVSILQELRSFVEGDQSRVAADLDEFDDGSGSSPVLTITPNVEEPGELVAPDHPISGNVPQGDSWKWRRRISVRPVKDSLARDLRIVTVRTYRWREGLAEPGDPVADVSTVIRTLGTPYPTSQVYDIYLLALDNVPGWWVNMDAMQPFVQAALADIEARNPGLQFRVHWITKLGYGRDDEYAPYTNETRLSTDSTPWAYVYPGRLPPGLAAARYYVPKRFGGRVNEDGATAPTFVNDLSLPETFIDKDGDDRYDEGERFTDSNDDDVWTIGNAIPYAVADMHNHCMRWPDEVARFEARVAAGLEDETTPTLRLLLDRMIAEPERFHNAIVVNLHGELLPMPPARNFSDAARSPEVRPGWRVVTHPELLRPARVEGNDTQTNPVRLRVYAYKSEISGTETLTTQREPFSDANGNGAYDVGESFTDWNGNATWDDELPITVVLRDGDFSQTPNAATSPSIRVRRLRGGIDADGTGGADAYQPWDDAPMYPEAATDVNGDGICQRAERWLDLDGDGVRGSFEPHEELDGDGEFSAASEPLTDVNGNGVQDLARPGEPFTDANGNKRWDPAEPYWDRNGDGVRNPATAPKSPWVAWNPADYGNNGKETNYVKWYGEPFLDVDGDKKWDAAETFTDQNGNGVRDGGYGRGEMWFEVRVESNPTRTVVTLHGTPLETPYESSTKRGLATTQRLYDLDYVPCPTPSSATATNRFERDLYTAGDAFSKNTARWILELPPAALRRGFESAPGANDGDRVDRVVAFETRLGADLTTGTMWPVRSDPANRSTGYAYFHASASTIPFSERYQFQGDPRHSPYSDTDRQGTTAPNGYNWYFDDLSGSSGNEQGNWPAFDPARLDDGWLGRGSANDVPRILSWLRAAVVGSEAVYTTLTGFSYYYLSIGGDVGADGANGFSDSIPMDGTPFGLTGSVYENTLTDGAGTSTIRGSRKHVRSNWGAAAGIRSNGYWWSKPWLGELCPDSAYATQWKPWGNLRAATGTSAGTFRLVRRADIPTAQQPKGTTLVNAFGRLADEGCTTFFNVGTSSSTFHHQYQDNKTGSLSGDGSQLATNYGFDIPSPSPISRPFGIATSGSGGTGPQFGFTDSFPRYSAALERTFFNHQSGQTGSGLVRLQAPGTNPRAARVVVSGIDRTLSSGSAFIARYSVVTLLHGFLAGGVPSLPNRISQVPRVELKYPTLTTEVPDPDSIRVQWATQWTRWDGRPYTSAYPADFSEATSSVRYLLLYSQDGGTTWRNMLDDSPAESGSPPRLGNGSLDPAMTVPDQNASADEIYDWPTPAARFPGGPYMVRVEAYRGAERLHYAYHSEKFYVDR